MSRFDIEPELGPDEYPAWHDWPTAGPTCPWPREEREPWDQDYEMAAAERGVELPPGYDEISPEEEAYYASLAHDCPRERFLDDPITQEYGVGNEMLHLIRCPVCEAREAEGDCETGPYAY